MGNTAIYQFRAFRYGFGNHQTVIILTGIIRLIVMLIGQIIRVIGLIANGHGIVQPLTGGNCTVRRSIHSSIDLHGGHCLTAPGSSQLLFFFGQLAHGHNILAHILAICFLHKGIQGTEHYTPFLNAVVHDHIALGNGILTVQEQTLNGMQVMDAAIALHHIQTGGFRILIAPAIHHIAIAHIQEGMASEHDHVTGTQIFFPIFHELTSLLGVQFLVSGNTVLGIHIVHFIDCLNPAHQRHIFTLEPEVRCGCAQIVLRTQQPVSQSFVIDLVHKVTAHRVNCCIRSAVFRRGILRQAVIASGVLTQTVGDLLRAILHLIFLHVVSPSGRYQGIFQAFSCVDSIHHLIGKLYFQGYRSAIYQDIAAEGHLPVAVCRLYRHGAHKAGCSQQQAEDRTDHTTLFLAQQNQYHHTDDHHNRTNDPRQQHFQQGYLADLHLQNVILTGIDRCLQL